MKVIKSVDVGSFALYGALLAGFWALVFGVLYWILGWIFGANSWWIDMNLGNWSIYTMSTFVLVLARSFVVALVGALAGTVVALVYNLVASAMGGLKLKIE